MHNYEGFYFASYLKKYLEINRIQMVAISELLGINYETVRSKFRRDSFTYTEVLYLDIHYNLGYIDNFKQYLNIRKQQKEEDK